MGGGVWEQTRFVVGKIGIDSCGDKPLQDAFKAAALCSQDTMIPTHPPLNLKQELLENGVHIG